MTTNLRTGSPNVVDSYTGFKWCSNGLHLLAPWTGHCADDGRCRTCQTRYRRKYRKKKK